MNQLAKGGRGKRAPYESTHYRLPVPLKPLAEEMAANYRELVGQYEDPHDPALIAAVILAIALGDNQPTAKKQAIAILTEALTLPANKGGAIKEKIKQVIKLLS